jgi:hypothetical protein
MYQTTGKEGTKEVICNISLEITAFYFKETEQVLEVASAYSLLVFLGRFYYLKIKSRKRSSSART